LEGGFDGLGFLEVELRAAESGMLQPALGGEFAEFPAELAGGAGYEDH
jgi:hypothetical protein